MSKDKSSEQVSNSDETGSEGKSESGLAGEGPNGPNALDEEPGANAKSKKSDAESNTRSSKSQTPKLCKQASNFSYCCPCIYVLN